MDSKQSIKATIIKHLEGELQEREVKELAAWISESDVNEQYYTSIKNKWEAAIDDMSRIADTENEWSRFLSRIKKDYQSNVFRYSSNARIFYRFAAILIVGIVMGALVMNRSLKQEPVFITFLAPKGSISQMVLADSSIVYLNAGSEIRYSPEAKNNSREVFLKGEAWFNVTKNTKKPFVVHTPYYNVNVTGTCFNIKAYENDAEVTTTLEEGAVEITSSEKFKLAENILLQTGQQVVFNKYSRTLLVRKVNTNMFTSWKENKLMFINMNLKELIVLLERKYGVNIEVSDNSLLDYHYDGTIRNETVLEVLNLLEETLPIKYKIENQIILITKK